MNPKAAALLSDLESAGVVQLYTPRPSSSYIRKGTVVKTEETEKIEINGMRCGVTYEDKSKVRIYVFVGDDETKKLGPYTLKPSEVV